MSARRKPARAPRRLCVGERVRYAGQLFEGLGDIIHSDRERVTASFDLGVLRLPASEAKVLLKRASRGEP